MMRTGMPWFVVYVPRDKLAIAAGLTPRCYLLATTGWSERDAIERAYAHEAGEGRVHPEGSLTAEPVAADCIQLSGYPILF